MSSVPKTWRGDFARATTISEWLRAFFFDLKQWAMDGQAVPLIEAKSYRQKQCNVQEALKYFAFLDMRNRSEVQHMGSRSSSGKCP